MFANNSLAIVARDLRRLPLAGIKLEDAAGSDNFDVPADVFELCRNEGCKDSRQRGTTSI